MIRQCESDENCLFFERNPDGTAVKPQMIIQHLITTRYCRTIKRFASYKTFNVETIHEIDSSNQQQVSAPATARRQYTLTQFPTFQSQFFRCIFTR
jgi:hypothetical protein